MCGCPLFNSKDRIELIKFMKPKFDYEMNCLFFADALLADLQNTVPGTHLNPVNGTTNGTSGSGYGLLKGARRKEPQVSVERWIIRVMFGPHLSRARAAADVLVVCVCTRHELETQATKKMKIIMKNSRDISSMIRGESFFHLAVLKSIVFFVLWHQLESERAKENKLCEIENVFSILT